MAKPASRSPRKKERKNIISGVAHVLASFNNTMVNITDAQGNTIAWSSAGSQGFKGSRNAGDRGERPRFGTRERLARPAGRWFPDFRDS
jgi:Ribosomal protein S11